MPGTGTGGGHGARGPDAYRCGVLGAGRAFERLHLPALRGHPRWTVAAAYDPRPDRLERVRSAFPGAALAESVDALLAADLDAVLVLTPPESHAELTIRALDRGRAVLVEKPLAPDVRSADAVVDAWRVARRPVLVGFSRRFRPPYVALRDRLVGGSVRTLRFTLVADARRWAREAGSEGLLHDLASHGFDLLPWLAGRPLVEVRARADRDGGVSIEGALGGGTEVALRVARDRRYAEWLVAEGTDGRWIAHPGGVIPARLAPVRLRPWIAVVGAIGDALRARLRGRPTYTHRSLVRQLDELAARLDGDLGHGGADPAAGRRSVEAVRACRSSLNAGGAVVALKRPAHAVARERPSDNATEAE